MGDTKPMPTGDEIQAQFEDGLGFLVHDVARAFTAVYTELAKPLCLTGPQARVVAHVARDPGISQKDLAAAMSVGTMSITGILDRMEEKDLVRRSVDPADRRVRRVFLTPNAQDLLVSISELSGVILEAATQSISDSDVERLIAMLRAIKCDLAGFIDQLGNPKEPET